MNIKASSVGVAVATLVGLATPAAQQSPVFRSAVDLVTVDATVVDDRGHPIRGLTATDFQLEVDGAPRRVVSVQFVEHAQPAAEPASAAGPAAMPVSFSSNESIRDGRLVLVAVDQANIRRLEGRLALRAAADFVDALNPADRVSVAGINYAGELEFTADRDAAKRAIESLTGQGDILLGQAGSEFNIGLAEALRIADGSRVWLDKAVIRECGQPIGRINSQARIDENEGMRDPCPTQIEQESRAMAQEARTRASLSLNELLDLIRRLASIDGPKTLVLLSEGLIAEPQLIDLTTLGSVAQAARVTVYVLQLDRPLFDATDDRISPTLEEDRRLRSDGLARLAGAARGALFQVAGGDPEPFRRIARELSGYYLLAFEPEPADRDGRPHRINLALDRRGATLRARNAFQFEPASAAMAMTERRIVELLRSENIATELPIRATTYSYYEPASGKVRVLISSETDHTDEAATEVLFGYVLLDAQGVIVASRVQETTDRRFSSAATVAPGVYTLKVAAIDRFGRPGSVPRAVLAGIADASLPTSELLVARVNPAGSGPLEPIVDETRDSQVLVYLELYPEPGRSIAAIDVLLSLVPDSGGEPRLTIPAAIATRGAGYAEARAVLQLGGVPHGRYRVTANVTEHGAIVGSTDRDFTIIR